MDFHFIWICVTWLCIFVSRVTTGGSTGPPSTPACLSSCLEPMTGRSRSGEWMVRHLSTVWCPVFVIAEALLTFSFFFTLKIKSRISNVKVHVIWTYAFHLRWLVSCFSFHPLLSLLWSPPPTVQNPRHGSWIRVAVTTTTCPVPSSTRARSSSCPTLRTRASGCGICPKGPECRPSAGTMIASGCWGLTQTSTCLLLVGGDTGLHLYTFKCKESNILVQNIQFMSLVLQYETVQIILPSKYKQVHDLKHSVQDLNMSDFVLVKMSSCSRGACLFKLKSGV